MFLLFLGTSLLGFFWGGEEVKMRSPAADARMKKRSFSVNTKPRSVLAERKLLMRLDGVCRHYLAMTKSALFLFTVGGKTQ